jgi:hypothetical protein
MRYTRPAPDSYPDPAPLVQWYDEQIRRIWSDCSKGLLDIEEANAEAVRLINSRDRLADLADYGGELAEHTSPPAPRRMKW